MGIAWLIGINWIRNSKRFVFIIKDGSEGGGIEVVELAFLGGDDECDDPQSSEEQGGGDHEVDDGHQMSSEVAGLAVVFFPARMQMATTVSELIGIRIAAMRALMTPVIARVAAMVL